MLMLANLAVTLLMSGRALALSSCVLFVAAGGAAPQDPPRPAPPLQTQPTFRGGTTLVPVDVRVVDRSGRPVVDLTEKDFQILENGVRQETRHFSTQSLVAAPPPADHAALRRTTEAAPVLGPQTYRIFLIVLGRGRLQPPAKGVDGMIHLVRERLLPQDRVAVMAWNRATDFTTNHEDIVQTLERFKKRHEGIEAALQMHFSGLAAIYGSRDIPPHLQKDIDAVFAGPSGTRVRTVIDGPVPNANRVADDERRATDALQRAEILATRPPGTFLPEVVDPVESLGLDMSLDELTSMTAQSMQDLAKITAGIRYLRYLDGEKHLLFVSPSGVFLPRADDDRSLASLAADARVAIDIIHTGGIAPAQSVDWRRMTSRAVSEETGGSYTSTSFASTFADRLDAATRFQYLLGYYPSSAALDGRFRRIAVRVNRPGLTVLFRRGYFATAELPPLDRRRILTYSRVTAAASYGQEVRDIALAVTAANVKATSATREVEFQIKIPPDRLVFTEKNGRKSGAIDVAVFCADDRERLVGQSWNAVELEMTPEAFQRFLANGLTYSGRVRVSVEARFVKVVVYDYGADVVGSTMVKIK